MDNPVVIITGGGSGIGRAAAIQFAQAGAHVTIAGRRFAPLEETAQTSERIQPIRADVSLENEIAEVVAFTASRWGRIDVLVNNAGVFVQRPIESIDSDRVTALFSANVFSTSLMTKAALPYLKETRGAIINVSSTFGHKAAPMISLYAASKAAVEQLTRCWAMELAPFQIRVNAVAPGPTETEILASSGLPTAAIEQLKREEAERVPLGRRGTPDEVANWIVHLSSPAATWLTGQVIAIDGGLSIA
ncbi:SDR family NAD(P)-dependent oxidoreductase [Aureliella helgolandensis]|uniref:General stress protein 39 n=1 Tax=Aureliella helgolandensis TaxID=2527968 RepID=A0A518G6K8_9BACT|nr:SDR family oxidoreductase [Aureliella helgolandensis]QDV24223.1 General stress protein 39 [Aureliella helgolandensis]